MIKTKPLKPGIENIGKSCVLINTDSNSSGLAKGTKVIPYTIIPVSPQPTSSIPIYYRSNNGTGSWTTTNVYYQNIALDEESDNSKEGIKILIKETKNKVKYLENKLDFIEETGSEEFDETIFKTYNILKSLENGKSSLIEKSKAIADIVNS